MKFLPLFLLFMTANVFAQTIDCQKLEKLRTAQGKKRTTRTFSSMSTDYSDIETTSEMDTSGRVRTLTKSVYKKGRQAGTTELRESLLIDNIYYTKSSSTDIWEQTTRVPLDTANQKRFTPQKPRFEDCHKVGSEMIGGKDYDIIESIMLMKVGADSTFKIRTWVNFQDSSTKKTEVSMKNKNQPIGLVSEYDVDITPIEKPLNAVPKKDKVVSYPTGNSKGTYPKNNQINSNQTNAEYKEGFAALFKFINTNLVYPQSARDAKKEGTVYLGFTVELDGTICDITVKRGIDKDCDEAAIELLKKTSGNWKPALAEGIPVRSPYTLPIKFKL